MKKREDAHGFWRREGRGMWLLVMFTAGIMCGLALAAMLIK